MFFKLCLVLRIFMDGGKVAIDNTDIVSCEDSSWSPSKSESSQTDKAGIPTSAAILPTDKPRRDDLQNVAQREIPTAQDGYGHLNSLWLLKPQTLDQQASVADLRRAIFRQPHLMTKLAKTHSYGFNPYSQNIDSYFRKNDFEPFERRTKPVTVLALKKKEPISRLNIKLQSVDDQRSRAAEMQSPYNEINNFWHGPADNHLA